MAVADLYFTGWESGDTSEFSAFSGTPTISSSVKRSGNYSLRIQTSASIVAAYLNQLGANGHRSDVTFPGETFITFYFRIDTLPGAVMSFISARSSVNAVLASLQIDASGHLTIADGSGSSSSTVATLSTGVWYRIDWRVTNGGTCGVKVNGGTEGTITGSNNAFARLWIGNLGSSDTCDMYYDDLVMGTAAFPAAPHNPCIRRAAVPTGAGNYSAWTDGTGSTFAEVDEIPCDGATTVIQNSAGTNAAHTFAMENAADIGVIGTIYGVMVAAFIAETVSASTLASVRLRSGSTDSDSTSADVGSISYLPTQKIFLADPADSGAWTTTRFDALEAGVVKGADNSSVRCSSVYLYVLDDGVLSVDVPVSGPALATGTAPAPSIAAGNTTSVVGTAAVATGAAAPPVITAEQLSQSRPADPIAECEIISPVNLATYDGTDGYDDGLYDSAAGSVSVTAVLSGAYGPVVMRYRYEQRTARNAAVADITEAVVSSSSSIDLDNDRAVMRTATFMIRRSLMPANFNYLTQCIAVFAEILVSGAWGRVQLGLFRLDEPEETYAFTDNDIVVARGSDVSILLVQPQVAVPYTVPRGANYITAVEALITALNLNHSFDASALTAPTAFTWPPGTPVVTIINELLDGINWYRVYADRYGTLTSRERISPFDDGPPIDYQTDAEPRMIRGVLSIKRSTALPANRIIANLDDPQRAPFSVIADNIDPNSPSSTVLVPIKATTLSIDRIVSQAVAVDAVSYKLRIEAGRGEQGTLTTHPDPLRGEHETYQITYYDNEVATRWRAVGWELPLSTGARMTHKLERAGSFSTHDGTTMSTGDLPISVEVLT